MIDDFIEALVEIGNHKRVRRECEPDIFCRQELKSWMVKRTLYAWRLFEDEVQRNQQSNNRNNESRGSKSLRKVSKKRNSSA